MAYIVTQGIWVTTIFAFVLWAKYECKYRISFAVSGQVISSPTAGSPAGRITQWQKVFVQRYDKEILNKDEVPAWRFNTK